MKRWLPCVICCVGLFQPVLLAAQSHGVTLDVPYATVTEAMRALLSRRNVSIVVRDNWSIITDAAGDVWSFVPQGHPGYPSLMRERVRRRADGAVLVDMAVLCQAEKTPCEEVIALLRQRSRETAAGIKFREMQDIDAVSAPR